MDKELLKRKLHEQIDAIDDELTLQILHETVTEYGKTENVKEDLTPAQIERLKESLLEVEMGNTVSHEEAKRRIREWLTR